ncbi:MAG: rod shape-determining protein RodA [Candidatus Zambryskibacteria bacterium]|nr:rod shape-determining protein RodA [Candidatus Zambryskibacteria bacterium]
MTIFKRFYVDWFLFVPAAFISLAGLVTMNSFSGDNYFFTRQSIWLIVVISIFFISTLIDWRFLRRTRVLVAIFLVTFGALALLALIGHTVKGAERWLRLGPLVFQPFDLARISIILVLAKYFSRRHVEIRNLRHILISGFYAFLILVLLFLQPNFGGALVVAGVWLGMVLISGISKSHLLATLAVGAMSFFILWSFLLAPYQKGRIISFINPLSDIHGAGYNAYQSTIAVGSGGIFGKGIGQGSQSKLQYLPEYETDFIFAAFTEEWGFVGAVFLLLLFLLILFRIVNNAEKAATNFEALFGLGTAILLSIHLLVHVGMNMGMLPVTGLTLPFMSYGGSHLLVEWLTLGILSSNTRHSRGPRVL